MKRDARAVAAEMSATRIAPCLALFAVVAAASPPAEAQRPCRHLYGARLALSRWCGDPDAHMRPYPYGWSERRTKRAACRALDRGLRRCTASAWLSDDGTDLQIELPVRFAFMTDWYLRLRRERRGWRVVHVAIVEDCTGP